MLDHLGVVIGGEVLLVTATRRHGEEPDEVGHPDMVTPLELRVLVPEMIDVPRLIPQGQVVQALFHDLLEDHEVGHQDLVHAAQCLEAMQIMTGCLGGDVGRFTGQPLTGGVNGLPFGFEDTGHRVLREPIDLQIRTQLLQLLGDGDVPPGVTQPDR